MSQCTPHHELATCNTSMAADPCGCSSTSQRSNLMQLELSPPKFGPQTVGKTFHGTLLLGLACLTSPCCVPLIVPILLGLLAGTPLAAWLTLHLGWMYGGLTLISAVSFLLGWRVFAQNARRINRAKIVSSS